MRPKGTRKYFHQRLTPPEKRKVIRRLRAGIKQIEIAREFGCLPSTVRAVRKAAGLGRYAELSPQLESRVIALLRQGTGFNRVAKMARLSRTLVREIMDRNHIRHAAGDPGMSAAKRAKIVERVLRRDDFGNHIASKEGVSGDTVLRIAHKLYGPGRFRNREQPLTFSANADANVAANCKKFMENIVRKTSCLEASVENFADKMNNLYVTMIEKHLALWHGGQIPADRDTFLNELLELNMPKTLRGKGPLTFDEWDAHRLAVAGYIRTALEHVAAPQSRWTN